MFSKLKVSASPLRRQAFVWITHSSLCGFRFRIAGAEIAAFLQCKQ
nr:Hok/Gef family protein [Escherichia coli]